MIKAKEFDEMPDWGGPADDLPLLYEAEAEEETKEVWKLIGDNLSWQDKIELLLAAQNKALIAIALEIRMLRTVKNDGTDGMPDYKVAETFRRKAGNDSENEDGGDGCSR